MGSFTKKYIRSFHPEDSLHLTWDIGYKNVAVYDGKRLVKQFEQAGQFTKGVSFQDEKLGKIRIEFTATKPLLLELKVNGKKYKPTKKGKQVVDLSGVIAVYWAMMAFSAVLLLIGLGLAGSVNNLFGSLQVLGIMAGITGIYLFSAITMSFKKYWGFYIGLVWMMLSTAWYTFNVLVAGPSFLTGLYLVIRGMLLFYLILNIRNVAYAVKSNGEVQDASIIDNDF